MKSKFYKRLAIATAIAASCALNAPSATAASANWTQTGAGPFSWNDILNWDAGIPNGASETATFGSFFGPTSQSITLDAPITVGSIDVTNAVTNYTISNGSGGSFTLNNGASPALITHNFGGLAQTINANIALTAGVNVTTDNALASTDTLTIGGNISGTGPLVKLGTGNLILSGSNTFTGDIYFGSPATTGAVNLGRITLTGQNNVLPTNSVIYFHPTTYPPGTNTGQTQNTAQTYTSSLDIGSTSQTLSTLHLPGVGPVGGAIGIAELPTGANVTIRGTDGTLTLNGNDLYVGITNNVNGLTPLVNHTLNMSALTNFVFDNPNKNVAAHMSGSRVNSQNTIVANLTLAVNSTIKAANLLIGDTGPSGIAGGGRSILNIGSGTTNFNIGSSASTGRINIGYSGRSRADVGIAAGGNLTIRGFGGGSTPLPEFFIGYTANSADPRVFTHTFDVSAGTINALVTRMDIGTAENTGGRGGGATSSFTMGATSGPEGFTVGTLNIGRIIGTGSALAANMAAVGTFTMNNAGGVLNATTINLAENTITDNTLVRSVSGTFVLTDGTVKATTIQLGPQGGTATMTRSFNWTNGTIENPTGGNTTISGIPIALTAGTHTFNATGSNSITVDNGSVISGTSDITKAGSGTLNLAAVNTYTGNTTVSGGTLNITGNHTTGANYSVASGASLNTKNVRVTNALTVDGTATITANGGTAGASKVESLTIGAGGKLNLKDNDLVVGTAPNFNAVRTAIIAGKTNNAATGITSDITGFGISRGFGYAMGNDPKVSSLLAGSLAGQTFDTDSVLVKFTLLGDADLDGDTDLNDLGLWSNGYTGDLGANPPAPTTFWTGGDFDYDGDTDLNDLGLWSSTYTGDFNGGPGSLVVNAPNASPEAVAILNSMGFTVVPEPSTFVLAGVGLAGLAIAARRRKK